MHSFGVVIEFALEIYLWLLLARIAMSWVPLVDPQFRPTGVLLVIFETTYSLTDPPVRLFERIIPSIRIGHIRLSLGFVALFIVLTLLLRLNASLMLSN